VSKEGTTSHPPAPARWPDAPGRSRSLSPPAEPHPAPASGPELPLTLRRGSGLPLRAQLEQELRDAIRSGRLAPASRLPASRVLAEDLAVSRRLVVDAYAQLLAEGYLVARHGSGTFVAESASEAVPAAREARASRPSFEFFPGHPDLSAFPRAAWLRATRDVLRTMPDRAFGYPDPRGVAELRRALAEHLRRVRGVAADPAAIVVCSGAAQGLAVLVQALGRPRVAVEDPGLVPYRAIAAANGASLLALPVDDDGARVGELSSVAGSAGLDAILVTPAHQAPTGVVLSAARRNELLAAGAELDALVIEDDYDAEHRYDRKALAAIQGMAPDRVAYLGTASKSLAPALRLAWLVLPAALVEPVVARKSLADLGSPAIEQLVLARMLDSGAYDRHLRIVRRRYRARRAALVHAVHRYIPGARVTGAAAGLYLLVRTAAPFDGPALEAAARLRSVGVYALGSAYMEARERDNGLILGYANLAEPAIDEGVRRLGLALAEVQG
jgi:GntR family transcriptional regulator / MocR family aminotransferase